MAKTLIRTKDGELQVVFDPEAYEGAEVLQTDVPDMEFTKFENGQLTPDKARMMEALELKEALELSPRALLQRIKANEAELLKLRGPRP